jgi:riboflavin biosynthesis pyrimidine reductase
VGAETIRARIEVVYGRGELLEKPPGVVHVTSVWFDDEGRSYTLRIGSDTPQSDTDGFVLNLARARCDAIVTTGRSLREEPEVHHQLPEDHSDWRRSVLHKPDPPVSVVLTGKDDLRPGHPLIARASRAIVVTTETVAPRLAERFVDEPRIEIVGRAETGIRDVLQVLGERGFRSICIEAGPSTSRALYDEPVWVDELMLSVYLGTRLAPSVRGGEFLDSDTLARDFSVRGESVQRERSGPWSFRRIVNARS